MDLNTEYMGIKLKNPIIAGASDLTADLSTIQEIETWMSKNGYHSLQDFKGKMNKLNSKDPWAYSRAQYVKILMKPRLLRRDIKDV